MQPWPPPEFPAIINIIVNRREMSRSHISNANISEHFAGCIRSDGIMEKTRNPTVIYS